MNPIPIGITARYEARNILALLDSLRRAVVRASAELGCRYELHVLLNDNTDHSPELLADASQSYRVNGARTAAGLIAALGSEGGRR